MPTPTDADMKTERETEAAMAGTEESGGTRVRSGVPKLQSHNSTTEDLRRGSATCDCSWDCTRRTSALGSEIP